MREATDFYEHSPEDDVKAALAQYADRLLSYPNVNGVGIGEQRRPDGSAEPVIHVYVNKKLPLEALEASAVLPEVLMMTMPDESAQDIREVQVKVRVQEIGDVTLECVDWTHT